LLRRNNFRTREAHRACRGSGRKRQQKTPEAFQKRPICVRVSSSHPRESLDNKLIKESHYQLNDNNLDATNRIEKWTKFLGKLFAIG
jgi:hypothetical protein